MTVPELGSSPALQRILAALEKRPNMSVSDLSAQAFVGVTTLACGGYIRELKKRCYIYVSGWRRVKGKFSTPLYSVGKLADVARPRIDETCRDAPGMQRIVETLEHYGSLTYRDIAKFSGLALATVKNSGYLDALIAQGKIHVGGWQRSHGGPMSPVYFPGPGAAVQKPPAVSAADKLRRHRERNRIACQGIGMNAQLAMLMQR
jgi:hypothetical protein